MNYSTIFRHLAKKPITANHFRCGFLFLLLLFCGVTGANAQYIEQVHLKNGSIIKGIITEQVPEEYFKIRTSDGSVFVYSYNEVERITKDAGKIKTPTPPKDSRTPRYEGGVYGNISYFIDYPFSLGIGAITTHGCLINPHLYIGGGVGVGFYSLYDALELLFPVFTDFRGYFIKGNLKPYAELKLGYDIGINSIYLSPAVGLRYKYFDFSLGIDILQLPSFYEDTYGYYDLSYSEKVIKGSLSFKIGARF